MFNPCEPPMIMGEAEEPEDQPEPQGKEEPPKQEAPAEEEPKEEEWVIHPEMERSVDSRSPEMDWIEQIDKI